MIKQKRAAVLVHQEGRGTIERVELYSPRAGNEPPGVIAKNQMKRWGSCTKDGNLNLNWKIIMVPMSVVEYVVVHELVHLSVQDHSREFWQKMKAVFPDYERRKEWFRVHGLTLNFWVSSVLAVHTIVT